MISNIIGAYQSAQARQRINIALSRGALSQSLRTLKHSDPKTWEFSAFSQNGEDGIIDYLCTHIDDPNRYFIEIGSAKGIENNSAFLALVKKYSGLMIEGSKQFAELSEKVISPMNLGIEFINLFVTKDNISVILQKALYKNPDFFSLDIDGNDFYVAKNLFEAGLRPAVVSVEYNSTFGAEQSITIKYKEGFDYMKAHPSQLYYGVSIKAWKSFFEAINYKFITVDQNGVNAFFVDPGRFSSEFLETIDGYDYKENFFELRKYKMNNKDRFELIRELEYQIIQ